MRRFNIAHFITDINDGVFINSVVGQKFFETDMFAPDIGGGMDKIKDREIMMG